MRINKHKMKTKIIIDLDVLTVGFWDKSKNGDYSRKFMARVNASEFFIITPTSLIELVGNWKHQTLRVKIQEYYVNCTNEYIEKTNIIKDIISKDIDFESLFEQFINEGIKEEDILLILVSSIKDALLVTFNRVHLRNKVLEINRILSKNGLKNIKITSPEQF